MNENISLTFDVNASTKAAEASIENTRKKYDGEQIKLELGLGKDSLTPAIDKVVKNSTGKFAIEIDDSKVKHTASIITKTMGAIGKNVGKTFTKAVSTNLDNDNTLKQIVEEQLGKTSQLTGKALKSAYDKLQTEIQNVNIGEIVSKQDYEQLVLVINKLSEMEALYQRIKKVAPSTPFTAKGFNHKDILNTINSLTSVDFTNALSQVDKNMSTQMMNLKKYITGITSIVDGKFETNFDSAFQSIMSSSLADLKSLVESNTKKGFHSTESQLNDLIDDIKKTADVKSGNYDPDKFKANLKKFIIGGGDIDQINKIAQEDAMIQDLYTTVNKKTIQGWEKQVEIHDSLVEQCNQREAELNLVLAGLNGVKEESEQIVNKSLSNNETNNSTKQGTNNNPNTSTHVNTSEPSSSQSYTNHQEYVQEMEDEQSATSNARTTEVRDFEAIETSINKVITAIENKTKAIVTSNEATSQLLLSESIDMDGIKISAEKGAEALKQQANILPALNNQVASAGELQESEYNKVSNAVKKINEAINDESDALMTTQRTVSNVSKYQIDKFEQIAEAAKTAKTAKDSLDKALNSVHNDINVDENNVGKEVESKSPTDLTLDIGSLEEFKTVMRDINNHTIDINENMLSMKESSDNATSLMTKKFKASAKAIDVVTTASDKASESIHDMKSEIIRSTTLGMKSFDKLAKSATTAKNAIDKILGDTSVNNIAEPNFTGIESGLKSQAEIIAKIKSDINAETQAQAEANAKAEIERVATIKAEAEAKAQAKLQAQADKAAQALAQKQSKANDVYDKRNKDIKEWINLKNQLIKTDKDSNPAYTTELKKQADALYNDIYNSGRRLNRAVKNGYFDSDKLQTQNDSYELGKADINNSERILKAQKKDEANLKLANEINEAKEKEIALVQAQEKNNSNRIYAERNKLLAEWISLQKTINKLDTQSNPAYADRLTKQAKANMDTIDELGQQLGQYSDNGVFDSNKLKAQNEKITNSQIVVDKSKALNEAKKQDEADLKIVKDIESARKQELALIKESYALRIKLDKETNSWNFNDNENDSNVVKALKSKLDGVEKQSDNVGKYLHNAFINNPDGRAEYLETLGNAISESKLERASNLEKQQQAFLKKNGSENFDNISIKRDSEYQTQLASKANAKLEELNQSYISTEISNKQYIDRFNQLKDTLKKDLELSNKFDDIKKSVGDIYKVSKSKYRNGQDVGNLEDVAISSLQAYSKMNEIYKTNPTKAFENNDFKKNLAIVNQNRKIIEAVRNEKHYAGNISKNASQAEIDNFIKKDMSSISGEKYSNVKILKTTDDYAKGLKKVSVQAQDAKGVLHNFKYTLDGTLVTMKDTTSMSFTKRGGILGFIDAVKSKSSELAAYWTSNLLNPYQLIGVFQQGFAKVRELDTAFVEMRKVSNDSIDSLQKFKNESFGIGESIGTTGLQMQSSAADFMRLGYNLDSASVLSKDANIYKNVGDMDIESATEHMISSIKAWGSEFNSDVEASGAIVDRYNEIGNNFSITSAGIGSAMEKSASALKAGGNTLNEALGLIVAGNEVTQDPDTVANAIKVGSLRIRGAKTELAAMGEDTDGLASSTSKLREELKNLTGVDIMKDSKTFKSTAQIYEEIGKIFDGLSDVSQANVLEKLFGKTRASVGAGLLENYETIQDVINSAENADGSALKENETYMDSIEGKMSKLSTEAEEFWSDLIDSGSAKDLIDILASILDKFDSILKVATKLGGLPGLVGGAIGFGVGKSGYGKRTIEILNVTNVLCPLL